MIQLSGGIALASMAGCLGSEEDPDEDPDDTGDDSKDGNNGEEKEDEKKENEKKEDEKPKNGDDAPKVDVETPDGETITVEAKDKPTVVLFADIRTEEGKSYSKTLVDLHEEYGDRAYVLTINSNTAVSKKDLEEFHEKYGGDWDHATCDDDVLEKYGIEASVTIYVIDEDGKIAFHAEEDIDRKTVKKALEAYADGDVDEEDIEKAFGAYREGEIDQEDMDAVLDAYKNGDIDDEDIEAAIETYQES
ncbi:peroxiredoxin family protein [Halalkalicoccus subterraneus]|uniref:peroxiredoxin family protein n=1 Tax=Halalkalicoccus subterraneus TaxID=2675002 RepID=UPI000EFD4679|nr:redoxin domain-containing protein [Halalkalicoccus subterraneus]